MTRLFFLDIAVLPFRDSMTAKSEPKIQTCLNGTPAAV